MDGAPQKKVRPDAVLKNLPEERQAEIAEYAAKHTYRETLAWLRADGLQVGKSALSDWFTWYQLREQWQADEATTDSLLEQLKKEVPGLSEEQIDELGQRTFSLLSIRRQDLEGFVAVRSARAKAELEREKLKLREASERRLQEGLEFQRQKFKESVRTKLQAGLDAVAEAFKGKPDALALYEQARAMIAKETE